MVRASRRPFGVTFAVIWAIVLAGLLLARAAGQGAVPAVLPEGVLSGLALTAVQGTLAGGLLFVGLLVFKLVSWGRRLAMLTFLLAAAGSILTILSGSLFAFVVVALDVTAVFMLGMHAESFRSKRPDIDDSGSATHFGAP